MAEIPGFVVLIERFFNPYLTAKPGSALARFAGELQDTLNANTERGRKHSTAEHARWLRTTDAIIVNLAKAALYGHALIVPLSQKGWTSVPRYARHGVGYRTYIAALNQMHEEGVLVLAKSTVRGTASTATPSRETVAGIARRKVATDDFGRVLGDELIVLTNKTREGRRHIDYHDGPRTRAMRKEVEALNAFLASCTVTVASGGGEVRPIDADMLRLRRRFSYCDGAHDKEPWDFGGRLFAGWQSALRKADRAHLRINGEPTAEIDANAMFARLAAARLNTPDILGDCDLYSDVPGFETSRDGLKLALMALLFAPAMRKFPKAISASLPSDAAGKPAMNTVTAVKRAMVARAAVFEDVFKAALEGPVPMGFRLMRTESDILESTLWLLMAEGVPALPLHDGLVVARRSAERAAEVFAGEAWRIGRAKVPVRVKGAGEMDAAIEGDDGLASAEEALGGIVG